MSVSAIPLHREYTSAPNYELDELDRDLLVKVEEAIQYIEDDPIKDYLSDEDIRDALILLFHVTRGL